MQQKKSRRVGPLLITIINCLLIVLLLTASGFILTVSISGDMPRFLGYQLYLTDNSTLGIQEYRGSLLAVKSAESYRQGDAVLLKLASDDGQTAYAVCTIQSMADGAVTVPASQLGEEMTFEQESIQGQVSFSSPFLGNVIHTVSNPHNRVAVVIGLCAGFLICIGLTTLIFLLVQRRQLKKELSAEDAETLYQIEEIPLEPAQPAAEVPSLHIENLVEEEHIPLILEHPSPVEEQDTSQMKQPQDPSKAAIPEGISHAEALADQIIVEDHIDLNQVEITMTDDELEALKQEILNL